MQPAKQWLTGLAALLLLSACQRQGEESTGGDLLRQVVRTDSTGRVDTTFFEYDGSDRLTFVRTGSTAASERVVTEIRYDGQGRMGQALYYVTDYSNRTILSSHTHAFIYNGEGRIVRRVHAALSPAGEGGSDAAYGWDGSGRLMADTVIADAGPILARNEFTWDATGNVRERKVYQGTDAAPVHIEQTTFDAAPNPFRRNLPPASPLYFLSGTANDLNEHVFIRQLRPDGTYHRQQWETNGQGRINILRIYPEGRPQSAIVSHFYYG